MHIKNRKQHHFILIDYIEDQSSNAFPLVSYPATKIAPEIVSDSVLSPPNSVGDEDLVMKVLALAPSLFLDRDIQDKSRVHLLLVLVTTKLLGTDKQSHALPAGLFSTDWVDLVHMQIMAGIFLETSDNPLYVGAHKSYTFTHLLLAKL